MDSTEIDSLLRQNEYIPDESDGLKLIGRGKNRIVFKIIGEEYSPFVNYVVKRAYTDVAENRQEKRNSVIQTEYRDLFVPVKESAVSGF